MKWIGVIRLVLMLVCTCISYGRTAYCDNIDLLGNVQVNGEFTANGVISSTSGGFQFPDGTILTSSAPACGQWTTSGIGVIFPGASFVDMVLPAPSCPQDTIQLVHGMHVGPAVIVGASRIDVVNLPIWGASLAVYQKYTSGVSIQVALTALGDGPEHVSVSLPAGQCILDPSPSINVRIALLGEVTASHRFTFYVHVTGSCGEPFVATSQ